LLGTNASSARPTTIEAEKPLGQGPPPGSPGDEGDNGQQQDRHELSAENRGTDSRKVSVPLELLKDALGMKAVGVPQQRGALSPLREVRVEEREEHGPRQTDESDRDDVRQRQDAALRVTDDPRQTHDERCKSHHSCRVNRHGETTKEDSREQRARSRRLCVLHGDRKNPNREEDDHRLRSKRHAVCSRADAERQRGRPPCDVSASGAPPESSGQTASSDDPRGDEERR